MRVKLPDEKCLSRVLPFLFFSHDRCHSFLLCHPSFALVRRKKTTIHIPKFTPGGPQSTIHKPLPRRRECHRFLHTAAIKNRIIHPSPSPESPLLCPSSAEFIMKRCSPGHHFSHSLSPLRQLSQTQNLVPLAMLLASGNRPTATAASLTRG